MYVAVKCSECRVYHPCSINNTSLSVSRSSFLSLTLSISLPPSLPPSFSLSPSLPPSFSLAPSSLLPSLSLPPFLLSLSLSYRVQDLVKDPQLFTGGASRFDVKQGMLGDCWLVAAIASLTQDQILLRSVSCQFDTIPPTLSSFGVAWMYTILSVHHSNQRNNAAMRRIA